MRTAALATAVYVLVAGCGTIKGRAVLPHTPSMIPRPLVERDLDGLLLTPDQVNVAMGATAMMIVNANTTMSDNSATMAPPECLALDGAAEAKVYADSGFQAEREQSLNDGDHFTHYLKQTVVVFPTVDTAGAFLNRSVRQWPACHDYTHTQSGTHWTVGPITNTDGAMSATTIEQNASGPGWGCGRTLVHTNNVIIDINTCSADPADSALRIANQIAQNVAARW